MYQIKLIKTIKGKDIVERLKNKYGTLPNLKNLNKINKNDSRLCFDLEEWIVYENKLDSDVKETKILLTEDLPIGKIELELLNSIKSDNPESIRDLARLIDKDIKTVQPKIDTLAKEGFIELKKGIKNNKIPFFSYDSMEIVIGEVPISK